MPAHITTPDGRPLLSLAGDDSEDRGTSALDELDTVGEIRAGLTATRAWAAAYQNSKVCFLDGALRELTGWCDRADHLLRKSADEAIVVEVSGAALAAFDEIASWAVQVALRANVPDSAIRDTVPHLANFLPAGD